MNRGEMITIYPHNHYHYPNLPSVKWKIIYAKITSVQYLCTVCMNSMYAYVRRRGIRAERTNDRTQQLLLLLNDDEDDDECGY